MFASQTQLGLPMMSDADQWEPCIQGHDNIEWIRIPLAMTAAALSNVPVWISTRAHERCVDGLHPDHRAKDDEERVKRFDQVIWGVACWGRIYFSGISASTWDSEGHCHFSPTPRASEYHHARHAYSVSLSVEARRLFNNERVILICLWEERHEVASDEVTMLPRALKRMADHRAQELV